MVRPLEFAFEFVRLNPMSRIPKPALKAFSASPPPSALRPAPPTRAASPQLLLQGQEEETLNFLAAHPVQNVMLSSLIRDNGFECRLNRGNFYACRDAHGELTGVALVGHHTLFASECAETIGEFARQARVQGDVYVIVGERESIKPFWSSYAQGGETPLLTQRELLLERTEAGTAVGEAVRGLRLATLGDLQTVATVHAEMAFAESGFNPLEVNPAGFLSRLTRRMEQGRVWVWIEDGRLIFKTDITGETPEVIYLEGVYVHPDARGKGYGLRCLSRLSRELLSRAKSLCLLVNEANGPAQTFYHRAGFNIHSHYETIYLPPHV